MQKKNSFFRILQKSKKKSKKKNPTPDRPAPNRLKNSTFPHQKIPHFPHFPTEKIAKNREKIAIFMTLTKSPLRPK